MAGRREARGRPFTTRLSSVVPKQKSASYSALLECGCISFYPSSVPSVGDEVSCRRHGVAKIVQSAIEFRIRCRNCSLSRKYGAAELTAMTVASAHFMKRNHTVDIYKGGELFHTSGNQDRQLAFDAPAPFDVLPGTESDPNCPF